MPAHPAAAVSYTHLDVYKRQLELRKPLPLDTIAKRCGKSLEETKKQMDLLTEAGVVIFHSENGVDVFELPVFVPGVMEKMMNNRAQCEKHPEIPAGFEEYALSLIHI